PVAVRIEDQLFIGPDNGIFSFISGKKEFDAVRLTNEEYWLDNPSNTFHGRDIFAPVAAHLSRGIDLLELGEPLDELVTDRWTVHIYDKDGIQRWIIHIDKFGNLITNLSTSLIGNVIKDKNIQLYVGNTILNEIV